MVPSLKHGCRSYSWRFHHCPMPQGCYHHPFGYRECGCSLSEYGSSLSALSITKAESGAVTINHWGIRNVALLRQSTVLLHPCWQLHSRNLFHSYSNQQDFRIVPSLELHCRSCSWQYHYCLMLQGCYHYPLGHKECCSCGL